MVRVVNQGSRSEDQQSVDKEVSEKGNNPWLFCPSLLFLKHRELIYKSHSFGAIQLYYIRPVAKEMSGKLNLRF